ncbi:MAG: transposase [Microthrixaceae bacterium]
MDAPSPDRHRSRSTDQHGRYERTDDRVTHRNGTPTTNPVHKAGQPADGIPKLRAGSYLPSLLEPRRRIDQALYAVVMEAYVNEMTRSVDDLVAALGVDSGISKSEVSRICAGLDERVDAFRQPDSRPHRVPLRVSRRHLPQRSR